MTTPMRNPEFVYKITSRGAFDAARAAGEFPRMPIDLDDGYIHFSTAAQLAETLRLYFAGQSDLAVFAVSTYALGSRMRWEPSRGGQLFPHGYGEVPATLVGQAASVSVAADGSVTLPDFVR